MKRLFQIQLIVATLLWGLWTPAAMAIGLGFYTELPFPEGYGDLEQTTIRSGIDSGADNSRVDYKHDLIGFGFVLDTNVAQDSLFNYRLNLGYEKTEWDLKDAPSNSLRPISLSNGYKLNLDSVVMDNTFGFAVYRDKLWRVWLGPQVRLAFLWGDGEFGDGTHDPSWEYGFFGTGWGGVIGVNYNPGDLFTGSLTTGYRYTKYYGGDKHIGSAPFDYTSDYEADESKFFIKLEILFRIDDNF